MPDTFPTLADLIKINDQNVSMFDELSDLAQASPLFAALYAEPASAGTQHKYLKETGAPGVGFRAVNTGRDLASGADTLVTVDLKLIDATWAVDVAIAGAYSKGEAAFMARGTGRSIKTAFFHAEKQFVTGTTNDAAGFAGFAQAIPTVNYTTSIDANGQTAGTDYSSVYFITTGEGHLAVAYNDQLGGGIEAKEYFATPWTDADGKTFTAFYQPIMSYLTLTLGSKWDLIRIANISGSTGNKLTDDLLHAGYNLLPTDRRPTHVVMNRRSREQLRLSRTATTSDGRAAPTPTEWEGIPIICTDAIPNNETMVGD